MSLKVCYILPRLFLGKHGVVLGAGATNCISLALELNRLGVQVEILAPISRKCMEFLNDTPVREMVKPLPSIGSGLLGRSLGATHMLRRYLKKRLQKKHYDIVHSHSGAYPYAIVPLAVNRKKCVRVHSLYCPIGTKGGIYGKWWEMSFAVRFICNKLDKVVAVTENVYNSLVHTGINDRMLKFIPMSVDTRCFSPPLHNIENKYFPPDSDAINILFIGNASKGKGLIELLGATKILLEKRMAINLVVALENQSEIQEYSDREEYAKEYIKRFKLEKSVRLTGLIEKIENIYAEADLVIIPWNTTRGPSDYPMVGLEAMAMEKCIVSTPVGGCPEMLGYGKFGILTDGYTAVSIADAIEFAIKHPDVRNKIGTEALQAVKKFSIENSGKQMMELYESLLVSRKVQNE